MLRCIRSIETEEVVEGITQLMVPKIEKRKGPLSSKVGVSYNPSMEFSRDVSVIVLSHVRKKEVLDGLAGTGVRGVRFANEVEGDFEVTINDHSPLAYEFIKVNIRKNKLENAVAERRKLNTLLAEHYYDYIDIDPFGTPVQFLDSALQAIKNRGLLGITATDTAPLCGTYPKACIRKYGSLPLKTTYCHEIGLRILLACIAKNAARYELAIKPLLTHSTDHYFRVYIQIEKGARKCDANLENLGYVMHDFESGERMLCNERIEGYAYAGELWTSSLFDSKFLDSIELNKKLGTMKRLKKMLELWRSEANAPPLYYDVSEICKTMKVSQPKLSTLVQNLKDHGFIATLTHFSPTAFRTNATIEEIKDVILTLHP